MNYIYIIIIVVIAIAGALFFQFKKRKAKKSEYININNVALWSVFEVNVLIEINYLYRNNIKPSKDLYDHANLRIQYFKSLENPIASHDNDAYMRRKLAEAGFRVIGENVGNHYHTAKDLVLAWSKSPKHHKILSDSKYKYVGVKFLDYKGKTLICALFGKI